MAATAELNLTLEPMGKSLTIFFRLELLAQLEPNFDGMVLKWSSFRIISDDPARGELVFRLSSFRIVLYAR